MGVAGGGAILYEMLALANYWNSVLQKKYFFSFHTHVSLSLFQHLGYLDLYLLSIHSAQRRKKVYSLDQSGQPVVWNVIHSECLSLINSMTTRLSNKKLTNGIAGPGLAAAAAAGNGGSIIGGGSDGGFPPMMSQLSEQMSQHQSECTGSVYFGNLHYWEKGGCIHVHVTIKSILIVFSFTLFGRPLPSSLPQGLVQPPCWLLLSPWGNEEDCK